MRFAPKLALSTLPILLLIPVLSWYIETASEPVIQESLLKQSISLAEEVIGRVDHFVYLRLDNLQIHLDHRSFQESLLAADSGDSANAASDRIRESELSAVLRQEFLDFYERKYGYPVFLDAMLTSRNGMVVALTGRSKGYRFDGEGWWKEARDCGLSVGSIERMGDGRAWAVPFAVRVSGPDGSFLGVLRILLSGDEIVNGARLHTVESTDIDLRVVTQGGFTIYATGPSAARDGASTERLLARLAEGTSQTKGSVSLNSDGHETLISYARSIGYESYPGLGWITLVSQDRRDLLRPIFSLRTRIAFIGAVCAAFGVIVSLLLAMSITRPLRALMDAIRSGSAENSWRRVDPSLLRRRDEIGNLARAFTGLGEELERDISRRSTLERELRTLQGELEGKLGERTEELAREHARLRNLIDSMPDLIYVKDLDCRFVICNAAQLRMLGVAREADIVGKSDGDVFPSDMALRFYEDDRRVLDMGEPLLDREEQAVDPDGTIHWLSTVKVPIRDDSGSVIGLAGIGRDITRRKLAEEKVTSIAQFPEQNPNPVFRVARDREIVYTNPAARQLISGPDCGEGTLPQGVWTAVEEVLSTGSLTELEVACGEKSYSITVSPVSGTEQVNVYAHNITERKSLYLRLLQAQKMESFGRLAGGIAHDFNNLMGVVLGYSEMLLAQRMEPDRQRELVWEIRCAGERAASLTSQLLAFSRQQVLQEQVLDLNEVVTGATKMIGRLIGEDVRIATVLEPSLRKVRADQVQLEQVLMNLAVNARDAMPSGGILTIETSNVILDTAYIIGHPEASPGEYVLVSVTDTGSGMDEYTKAHLFEPFFTTKERGKGTGLGLSTVYGIVRQSGGHIWAYSEQGRGSTFKIYLPVWTGPVEERTEKGAPIPRSGNLRGSETILLVEDEEMLRGLLETVLQSSGYDVLVARDADEAIALCEKAERLDLLATDMVLPGMSGQGLADRLLELRPGLRTLFISGYTEQTVLLNTNLRNGARFLQKPFSPDLFVSKIREVLDGS